MNNIVIAKETNKTKWKSRGWYIAKGSSHYLSPSLKWQLGVAYPEDCFVKTRKLARERLKAWKEQEKLQQALDNI